MTARSPRTRLSRSWAREQPSRALHGIAGKLRNLSAVQDLSDGQEWLWEVCIAELEHRSKTAPPDQRCTCELCFGPFDFLEAAWLDVELPGMEEY